TLQRPETSPLFFSIRNCRPGSGNFVSRLRQLSHFPPLFPTLEEFNNEVKGSRGIFPIYDKYLSCKSRNWIKLEKYLFKINRLLRKLNVFSQLKTTLAEQRR